MGRLTCSLRFQLPSSSCSRPLPVFVFFSLVFCRTFRALQQPCSQQLSSQQPATLCRPLPTSWRQLSVEILVHRPLLFSPRLS